MPDVDIDFFDRDGVLKLFKHAPASIIIEEKIEIVWKADWVVEAVVERIKIKHDIYKKILK